MKIRLIILLVFSALAGAAQQSGDDWLPFTVNKLPTRLFTVKIDNRFNHNISSTSVLDEIGNGNTDILWNRIVSLDLKFPLVYKPKFILTGSAKFYDEEIHFEQAPDFNYPLYVSLEDRNLKNLGGNFYGLYHLGENRSLVMRSSFYLAGDFYRSDAPFKASEIMKLSMALGYGIKKNVNTYYAFGVYWGYTFGTPSVYPAIALYKRLGSKTGIDALLPQSIKIWRRFNNKTYLHASSKISGNSYTIRLSDSVLDEAESLQLRKSCLISSLGITRQIGKWLWLEAEGGISNSLNFNLSETNFVKGSFLYKPDTDYLIESTVKAAPFVSVSLFLSPPEEFLGKFRK